MIVARRGVVELHLEAYGPGVLRRPQRYVEVPAVEPEHDFPGCGFEAGALGAGVSQSAEAPWIEGELRWQNVRPS